ncbi:OmpA family protein [Shouchella shacheensis]|uniref:OmpA family protein n=1 Tax=Shouchella shacheensis TaxID=1649580 RepID=UPI00074002DD|nr:OmpA family protein [Shouchella shacheensis]
MPRNDQTRRKGTEEPHVDESWLLPYADMLTLLVALFIVLFAIGQVDQAKYDELRVVLSETLGGQGILDNQNTLTYEEQPTHTDGSIEAEDDSPKQIDLRELQHQLDGYIEERQLADRLQTELGASGLLVTINDGILFSPGSAALKPNAEDLILELSDMLSTNPPRHMQISGHTDDVPIAGAPFDSNWELSIERAWSVLEIFLSKGVLTPEQLSYAGYGEYQPIASNETVEGRQQNRRVEVLVLPLEREADQLAGLR